MFRENLRNRRILRIPRTENPRRETQFSQFGMRLPRPSTNCFPFLPRPSHVFGESDSGSPLLRSNTLPPLGELTIMLTIRVERSEWAPNCKRLIVRRGALARRSHRRHSLHEVLSAPAGSPRYFEGFFLLEYLPVLDGTIHDKYDKLRTANNHHQHNDHHAHHNII